MQKNLVVPTILAAAAVAVLQATPAAAEFRTQTVEYNHGDTALEGYLACGQALRDMDHRPLLPKIKAPTLVIAGKHDPATPPEANRYISDNIPGAKYAELDAAHMSNVEQPQAYTDAVLGFLTRH